MTARIHFTVVLKNGERYDANHLISAFKVDQWSGNRVPFISFTSSGILKEFSGDEVFAVEYHAPSLLPNDYCSMCDGVI